MQLVVADAGPLIALAIADVLPLVLKQFELCVPQAVLDECLDDPYAPGAGLILEVSGRAGFTIIPEKSIKALDSAYVMGLGSGEVAVLSYAQQHSYVALIDERRARRIAQQLGVAVVGSGAVLLALKSSGVIINIRPALVAWCKHGYFLSPTLQKQLLAAAGELT
jgi:predicted nucleic acid-binding protein